MGETYNKLSKWQDVSVDKKKLSSMVCLPLPKAIYMYKSMKKKFFMGAAILFQKAFVVSNGKPMLAPAIRRKNWPEWYC